MTLLLPLLMAYSLIGETFHEIAGTALFLLFLVHHALNRRWYGSLFRGRYGAARIFRTALDALLFAFMILQPVSGILLSRHLYTFLPVLPVSAAARGVHLLLAYWGYVLTCVHAGTHLTGAAAKLARRKRTVRIPACAAVCAVSAWGCFAFVKRGFPGYMTGRTAFAFFDHSEPAVLFLLDFLAVMVLFMTAGCLLVRILNGTGGEHRNNGGMKHDI